MPRFFPFITFTLNKQVKRTQSKRAFTFVEVLVGMGIAGVIMSTIYGIYYFGMKTSTVGFDQTSMQMDVRELVTKLSDDLAYAKEIVELTEKRIKFKKYYLKDEASILLFKDSNVQDITYEIEKEDGRWYFKRYVDILDDVILRVDEIDENIFTGYIERHYSEPDESGKVEKQVYFKIYDTFMDDMADRKDISLIRLNLKARIREEELEVVTKIALPFVHQRMLEPNWNGGDQW